MVWQAESLTPALACELSSELASPFLAMAIDLDLPLLVIPPAWAELLKSELGLSPNAPAARDLVLQPFVSQGLQKRS